MSSLPQESEATVNLGEKLAEQGLAPRGRGHRYPKQLKQNVVHEVIKKGLSRLSAAKRFNVPYPTVCQWVQAEQEGPRDVRARRIDDQRSQGLQPRPDYSAASQPLARPSSDAPPAAPQEGDIVLSRAEAALLASLVREAVSRIRDQNLRGQMAILALRLMS